MVLNCIRNRKRGVDRVKAPYMGFLLFPKYSYDKRWKKFLLRRSLFTGSDPVINSFNTNHVRYLMRTG